MAQCLSSIPKAPDLISNSRHMRAHSFPPTHTIFFDPLSHRYSMQACYELGPSKIGRSSHSDKGEI